MDPPREALQELESLKTTVESLKKGESHPVLELADTSVGNGGEGWPLRNDGGERKATGL